MNKIYLIADTHFNHNNIIKYCNRPFKDIEEMNKIIINNWNSIVDKDDIVYHLGDFLLGDNISDFVSKLNGKIYLVRGNHDGKSIDFYNKIGLEVVPTQTKLEEFKIILSHRPLADNQIPDGYINIHGHIHNAKLDGSFDSSKHKCVSVEVVDYRPIEIGNLLDDDVKLVNNRINILENIPANKLERIVIYCHGLGSNKKLVNRFAKDLLNNNVGVVSFDFPGHGDDKTDFYLFNLSLCIEHLEEVIKYVKDKYDVPICLFGSSFGGYVILNRLIRNDKDIDNTILMCPAINFCEIMELKTGISIDCFDTNDFMPLYNNIKIYKDTYLEFKNGDKKIRKAKFRNISIIQGMMDKTVSYNDIREFCLRNDLKLITIEKGKHELYDYDKEIVELLVKRIFNKEENNDV